MPSLTRRQPAAPSSATPMGAFPRDLEEYLTSLMAPWQGMSSLEGTTAAYPVDIREDEKHIYVDAELPGFDKNEIDVTLEQGVLSIVGEHKEEKEPKGQDRHRERRYNRVERSFNLPQTSNDSNVDARLENGVLHLVIDKAKEATAKKIEVK